MISSVLRHYFCQFLVGLAMVMAASIEFEEPEVDELAETEER